MTGTPRAPWTEEQDKKLRALVLSASSVYTIAKTLIRIRFGWRAAEGEGEMIAGLLPFAPMRADGRPHVANKIHAAAAECAAMASAIPSEKLPLTSGA